MKNIAKDQFLALTLTIPPYSAQVRVAEVFAKWDSTASNYRRQAQLLSLEKQYLAKRLLLKEPDRRSRLGEVAP